MLEVHTGCWEKNCFSSGKQGKIGKKLWKRKVLSFVNQLYRSSCLFSTVYIRYCIDQNSRSNGSFLYICTPTCCGWRIDCRWVIDVHVNFGKVI